MFPVGGVGVMVLGAVLAGAGCGVLAVLLRPRCGPAWSICLGLLVWALVGIALITLIPAQGAPGVVPAEGRATTCSYDIGGPAPDGQRLLNVIAFVPPAALAVLLVSRWSARWAGALGAPGALLVLAAYSTGIEKTQLELARIDRACDVTDIVDNTIGAAVGVLVGLVLIAPLRAAMTSPGSSGRH